MSRQQSNKSGLHSSAEKDSVREDSSEQHGKGSPVDGATGGRQKKTGRNVEEVRNHYRKEGQLESGNES